MRAMCLDAAYQSLRKHEIGRDTGVSRELQAAFCVYHLKLKDGGRDAQQLLRSPNNQTSIQYICNVRLSYSQRRWREMSAACCCVVNKDKVACHVHEHITER